MSYLLYDLDRNPQEGGSVVKHAKNHLCVSCVPRVEVEKPLVLMTEARTILLK